MSLNLNRQTKILRGVIGNLFYNRPINRRLFSLDQLKDEYNRTKHNIFNSKECSSNRISTKQVFSNNEIDLNEIDIYGFDYDYTLACYNTNLYTLIFNLAKDLLVQKYNYPKEIKDLQYLHEFPIRGLHFDKRNGWLMKIDSYHNIQLGTVYCGMRPVDDSKVKMFYNGTHVSIEDIGYSNTTATMHHYIDLFCLPEICLVALLIEYFMNKNITFSADNLFEDVQNVINILHRTELLHVSIANSIEKYLLPIDSNVYSSIKHDSHRLQEFFTRLQRSGKQIFLITNSSYWFVDVGMKLICSEDWQKYFDVIVCNARKPSFFMSRLKPFRLYDPEAKLKLWNKVEYLERGNIYCEGNLFQLLELTKWTNKKVLYFGDNLYSDLAQPFLKYGWRTGAIINELKEEIKTQNSQDYQKTITWLLNLENLIQKLMLIQVNELDDTSTQFFLLERNEIEKKWFQERSKLRYTAKNMFNPYFGSLFRTHQNPSFFSRRLSRFADIYTSNLSNLLEYPINYNFIPRRIALAHETLGFN